jgi:branched-chain amino acid transport system permease protein
MTTTDAARYTARIVRGSRSATIGTSLFAVTTVVLALLPWWGSKATQFTLVEVLYYLSLAQLWNLLAGYAGLVSVGQQGFVGVGAYDTIVVNVSNSNDKIVTRVLCGMF